MSEILQKLRGGNPEGRSVLEIADLLLEAASRDRSLEAALELAPPSSDPSDVFASPLGLLWRARTLEVTASPLPLFGPARDPRTALRPFNGAHQAFTREGLLGDARGQWHPALLQLASDPRLGAVFPAARGETGERALLASRAILAVEFTRFLCASDFESGRHEAFDYGGNLEKAMNGRARLCHLPSAVSDLRDGVKLAAFTEYLLARATGFAPYRERGGELAERDAPSHTVFAEPGCYLVTLTPADLKGKVDLKAERLWVVEVPREQIMAQRERGVLWAWTYDRPGLPLASVKFTEASWRERAPRPITTDEFLDVLDRRVRPAELEAASAT